MDAYIYLCLEYSFLIIVLDKYLQNVTFIILIFDSIVFF